MVAGLIQSCVAWRKKESRMKLKFGLNHFTKLSGFKFEVPGSEGIASRNIEMKSISLGDSKIDKKARYGMIKKLAEAQNVSAKKGKRTKFYLIDPKAVEDYNFVIDFRVNPQRRSSEAGDMQDLEEKINQYRSASQNINQRAVSKLLLKAHHDDEEELLNPEASLQSLPQQVPLQGREQSPQFGQQQIRPEQQLQPQI